MWQKCPVITFQTFDDLTGWLKSRLLSVSDCITIIHKLILIVDF